MAVCPQLFQEVGLGNPSHSAKATAGLLFQPGAAEAMPGILVF